MGHRSGGGRRLGLSKFSDGGCQGPGQEHRQETKDLSRLFLQAPGTQSNSTAGEEGKGAELSSAWTRGAAHQQPRHPAQPGRGRPVLGIGITAALRPRPLPATVRGTSLLGRRTMLAVGPPLHWHRDGASQQFVSAGLAPPVADQKGVYLGDWGVCQTPRACAVPPLPFHEGRPLASPPAPSTPAHFPWPW